MQSVELRSFRHEMEKLAFPGSALLRQGARWVTDTGAMRGGLLGAGVGAVSGAASGAGTEDGALAGAVRGALQGGAIGAAGGAAGRAFRDARLLNPSLSNLGAAGQVVKNFGTGVANFGRRQLHGVTGAYKDRLGDIGMDSVSKSKRLIDRERLRLADRLKDVAPGSAQAAKLREATEETIKRLAEQGQRGQALIDVGGTSIPGLVKGMANKETRGKLTKALWDRAAGKGPAGAAMAVGMPVAFDLPDIAKGDESATGGKSLTQKLTNTAGRVGASIATAGLPILPNIAAWSGADVVTDAPFNLAKKMRERNQ